MNNQNFSENARMALDTILQKPTQGIPTRTLHIMEHKYIERFAGAQPGDYVKNPEAVYMAMQHAVGVCMIDQYIPRNPLKMGRHGYQADAARGATTGAEEIVRDDIKIISPEAVVEHLEKFVFPALQQEIADFDAGKRYQEMLDYETEIQETFGPNILNCAGGHFDVKFPLLHYNNYGYANYFMAYALYPEVMERHFSLQADLYTLNNQAVAPLFEKGIFPPYYRLGQDLADSRGMLVKIETLDELWFPHFIRCMEPIRKTGARLLWHCDGNLNDMLPRLLDIGFSGFQGFQYEDGMDYEKICKMKTRDGEDLIIIGGVSVTRTLPDGTPDDVKKEIDWLVKNGPKRGLFLGCSSSIAPGVPWENLKALVEGLAYYRKHGRNGC